MLVEHLEYDHQIGQDGLDERFSGNGSYEVIYTSTTDYFRFQQQALVGSITNISILEITDDTNLPRINYSGFTYQDSLGSELITDGNFSNGLTNWTSYGITSASNGVTITSVRSKCKFGYISRYFKPKQKL